MVVGGEGIILGNFRNEIEGGTRETGEMAHHQALTLKRQLSLNRSFTGPSCNAVTM